MAPSPSPSSSPYTLENLPYGVISTSDNPKKRCAIAYEHSAIDIDQLFHQGFFSSITDSTLKDNVFSHVSLLLLLQRPHHHKSATAPILHNSQKGQLERLRRSAKGRPQSLPKSRPIRCPRRHREQGQCIDPTVQRPMPPAHAHPQLLRLLLLTRAHQKRKVPAPNPQSRCPLPLPS
jgi:hypothetical protein